VPPSDYAGAHGLFLNLQSVDFVKEKLQMLRQSGKDDALTLLGICNLEQQLTNLGCVIDEKTRERAVTKKLMRKKEETGVKSVFEIADPRLRKVAEICFDSLAKFSRLRDVREWTQRNQTGRTKLIDRSGVPAMLRHSLERISEPLTVLNKSFQMAAVRGFGNLHRCMGDKSSAYIGNKEKPIIDLALTDEALCDEVYVQVMKQLTMNPSMESATKGWQLLQYLCQTVLPSWELCEFLRAFIQRTVDGSAPRAESTQSMLSVPALAERRLSNFGTLFAEFQGSVPQIAAETGRILVEAIGSEPAWLPEVVPEVGGGRSARFHSAGVYSSDEEYLEDLAGVDSD